MAAPPAFFLSNALVPSDTSTEDVPYRLVDVLLDGGLIASITPAGEVPCPAAATRVDCTNKLLIPGMVNGHAHSTEHWVRGLVKPLPLELWIHQLVRQEPRGVEGAKQLAPSFGGAAPPSLIGLSALHCGLETLLGGATVIMDHLWVRHIDDVAAAVEAYRQLGLRTFIALMLGDTAGDDYANYTACAPNAGDRNAAAHAAGCGCGAMGPGGAFRLAGNPADPAKTARAVALWEEAIEKFHRPEEGINIAIGPVTCFSASSELIAAGAALRRKHGLAGHIHLLETQGQALQSRQYFGARGCLGMLHDTGFLGLPGTSLAHSVWLSDDEVRAVAEAGAVLVHNPASNLRLGSGVAPIAHYGALGATVSLGCDGACSSDGQDMREVLKLTALLHTLGTREYRSWLEPRDIVLKLATANGYAGVGLKGKGGVLAPGALADVVLYDLTSLSLLPLTDPLGSLVLTRPVGGVGGEALHSVWVGGARVVEAGAPARVDVAALRADLLAAYPAVRSRAATDPRRDAYTAAVEVEYRAAAGLDGTTRARNGGPGVDFLAGPYPAGRTLDDRTHYP